jgi:hypothetical protein
MPSASPFAAFGVYSLSHREHRVNSAPHCSGHAGGMTDPMLEGDAQRRKGEGEMRPATVSIAR